MDRYSRHILLDEIGEEGQQKLLNAKVLVIGAGGLGCPVLQYLTAAGVGTIGIVDPDFVSESNLQRQILYTTDDKGEFKVEVAAKRLRALNPDIEIKLFPHLVTSGNVDLILEQFDVVVDGTDQIHTRYMLNDACVLLNKPLVYGAIHKFSGQVSVFNFEDGATYRDMFPIPPNPNSVPTCNQVGVLGVLPGIIGIAQATEVLKIIVGFAEPLSGKVWLYNAKTSTTDIIEFQKQTHAEAPKSISELKSMDYISYCNPNWATFT